MFLQRARKEKPISPPCHLRVQLDFTVLGHQERVDQTRYPFRVVQMHVVVAVHFDDAHVRVGLVNFPRQFVAGQFLQRIIRGAQIQHGALDALHDRHLLQRREHLIVFDFHPLVSSE